MIVGLDTTLRYRNILDELGDLNLPEDLPEEEMGILHNSSDATSGTILDIVFEADKKSPFLDREKDLVLFEINPGLVERMALELAYDMGIDPEHIQAEPVKRKPLAFRHHGESGTYVYTFNITDPRHPVKQIIARAKSDPSLAEKVSRRFPDYGMQSVLEPWRPFVSDVYALTVVAENAALARELCEANASSARIKVLEREDLYRSPRESGYKAIHDDCLWAEPEQTYLDGLRVEIHYVGQRDRMKNIGGDPKNPHRKHDHYARLRLRKNHDLGPHQLVIVSHDTGMNGLARGKLEQKVFELEGIVLPLEVRTEGHPISYHCLREKKDE